MLTEEIIIDIISSIPEDWLQSESESMSPIDMRAAYVEYMTTKLSNIDLLVKEAADAR